MQESFSSQEDTPLLQSLTVSHCRGHLSGLALICPQVADTFSGKHSLIPAAFFLIPTFCLQVM